ncbi:MAG TPA: sensor domain-containing diguanylate cyclase [Pseudolabrys sp.]|nr:sensor domain-containing diguanylate cyclase [Pseudolabrys sp.]
MPAAETAAKRTINRLIAPIFVVVFCFCAICAYVLVGARHATLDRAAEDATSLAAAIQSDISRNIETLDLSLQGVADNLKNPEFDKLSAPLRHLVLFDRSATARHLGKIVVLNERGDLRYDSRTLEPLAQNVADRDYFQAHKDNPAIGMYISRPAISRSSGERYVAISRRLSRADGSFAGVVAATLRLSYFEQLFKDVALGPNGNVTLSRTDGIVLMRWPYKEEYIGLNLRNAALYEHLTEKKSGRYEAHSATDGLYRLIVYSQIGDLPLVIGVGQATADIYAQWYEYSFGIFFILALLCMGTVAVTMYLGHELRKRKDAEVELASLAATDGLTGLSNRRSFNEMIFREWQRARRERSPLALLMIDTDYFKTYNDVHGHQAGDKLLQNIGAAIDAAIERGGDIGARYGGDEFAILLPGTTVPGAKLVAEKLHRIFAEICAREAIGRSGLSIGIACLIPDANERLSDLIEQADHALYRAKHSGRNRTEVASEASNVTASASPPGHPKAA